MIFQGREQLNIVEHKRDYFTFEEVNKIFLNEPRNVIYVEKNGLLNGIVSVRDIEKAKLQAEEYVYINKQFTKICGKEYALAKKIFSEKPISAIPVVDENGILQGNYNIWDDNIYIYYYLKFFIEKNRGREDYNRKHLVLVISESCESDHKEVVQAFEGIGIRSVRPSALGDLEDIETFLFLNLDMARGVKTIYEYVWGKLDVVKRCKTCREYFDELWKDDFVDKASEALHELKKKGVHVIAFDFDDGEYTIKLKQHVEEVSKRYNVPINNGLQKVFAKAFFDDLYEEERDYEEIPFFVSSKLDRNIIKFRDVDKPGIYIKDGIRRTTDQPTKARKNVYMYGPCVVVGPYVEDRYTIASYLQRMLCEEGFDVKVMNKGAWMSEWILQNITSDTFKEGDVVIFDRFGFPLKDMPYVNMTEVVARNNVPVEYFSNVIRHCNHKVNQLIAKELFPCVRECLQQVSESNQMVQLTTSLIREEYIQKYFYHYEIDEQRKTGAVVMNCNPFTLGHRYLIEKASESVDRLIVFVVEEDLSYFPFFDRFAMVCEGVADLEKVVVVPGGNLILSMVVFPEYFEKKVDEDIVENVEQDVINFAELIANVLDIKYRFVGEEPEDEVTEQYNRAMKRLLPRYGIELIEIPRKTNDGKVISASRVRKFLEANDWQQLGTMLPETTIQYIKNGKYNGRK